MLLAIDTSVGTSVAVVDREAGILAEFAELDTRRHAEVIGTLISEALAAAGVATSRLSGVAVGMGPGPFTGLRVGIAAGRAFAFGAGKPVVPVISHDAVAFGATEPLLVVTDARRHEVYFSTYSGTDSEGLPVRVAAPGLCRPDQLDTEVDGASRYRRVDAGAVSAASIGLIAELQYANKRALAPNTPLYLRSPDVTQSAGPKRVTG